MSALLVRILVLSTAFFLVLPPGWCCIVPSRSVQKTPPKTVACCHCKAEKETQHSTPSPAPLHPAKSCCQWDSTVPPSSKTLTLDWTLAVVILTSDVFSHCFSARGDLCFASPFLYQSLHILQCVWRC
jgi:hypothetical protein